MNEIPVGRKPPRLTLTVLAAVHLTVVLWHGSTHSQLAIMLSPFQTLFVFGVIVIAPILATLLLWLRLDGLAMWIYAISMLASLLFGVYYHYIAISPDNVHYLPSGAHAVRRQFILSAAAVAVAELIATVWSGRRLSVD
jgi:predicted neutral ceramidase superfamily lipid hydrolase